MEDEYFIEFKIFKKIPYKETSYNKLVSYFKTETYPKYEFIKIYKKLIKICKELKQ